MAAQSGFVQTRTSVSLSRRIMVGCPQTGHSEGIASVPEPVRFSAIWGMIIFALYTVIRSPIPSFSAFTMLILWTEARFTVVPSSSTGSKIATGLIRPVLLALHSTSVRTVSLISSAHLKAMEFLGNLAVVPRDSPYAISSSVSTSPSDGISFCAIRASNSPILSATSEGVTRTYSTVSNPCSLRNSICLCLELSKSRSPACTSEKA